MHALVPQYLHTGNYLFECYHLHSCVHVKRGGKLHFFADKSSLSSSSREG